MISHRLLSFIALFASLASAASTLPELRILPIGDSITAGSGSSTGNGYRHPLYEILMSKTPSIDFVGTQRRGDMTDDDHEGYSGQKISDMIPNFRKSMAAKPNVVLLHVGINDMNKEFNLKTCPIQMEALLDTLQDQFQKAAILVMPVTNSPNKRLQNNTDAFNKILTEKIMPKNIAKGWRMALVPVKFQGDEMKDYLHPNDKGYEKMASAWAKHIEQANEDGWIEDPEFVSMDAVRNVGLGTREERLEKGLKKPEEGEKEDQEEGQKEDEKNDEDSGVGKTAIGVAGLVALGLHLMSGMMI